MASTASEAGRAAGYERGYGSSTANDWVAEVAAFGAAFEAGAAAWKAEHPYSVTLWDSDPDAGNDDCSTGIDFATRDEALAAFADPWPHVDATYYRPADTDWLEVDGPDVHDKRQNPAYRPRRQGRDDEWMVEIATQAGMAGGCDAYNDAMGY
jgi:hypothetical protein